MLWGSTKLLVIFHQLIIDEAHQEYTELCKVKGEIPEYTRSMFPTGDYGGQISFLCGIKNVKFTVVHEHKGLIFIKHNINVGQGMSVIAMGGSYCPAGDTVATCAMYIPQTPDTNPDLSVKKSRHQQR